MLDPGGTEIGDRAIGLNTGDRQSGTKAVLTTEAALEMIEQGLDARIKHTAS